MSESQQFFRQLLQDRNYFSRPSLSPELSEGLGLERLVMDESTPRKDVFFHVDRADGNEIFQKARRLRILCDLYRIGGVGWILTFHSVSM